jgi:hypothetical protein
MSQTVRIHVSHVVDLSDGGVHRIHQMSDVVVVVGVQGPPRGVPLKENLIIFDAKPDIITLWVQTIFPRK